MTYIYRGWPASLVLLCGLTPALAHAANTSSVDGTVFGSDGRLLVGAQIELDDDQGKKLLDIPSDNNGHYLFVDLAQGSYVIHAVKDDTILGSTTISIIDETPIHKDLTLKDPQALDIVVAARHMHEARNNLSPQTGTSAYKIDQKAIDAMPNGADTSFDKVLEQAPGVAEDSYGQVHIRGEHANLQYRLNGILLPEGISGFGQAIDSRLIDSSTLLTGALPAQYGYRTAGVVDIQTKTGFDNGGHAEMTMGSYGTIQPSVTYGGVYNDADYFLSASHLTSDIGIEAPTSATRPVHDHTEQDKEFAYMSYMINPMQRVSIMAGSAINRFEIPNNPNQTPTYTLNGQSTFDSSQLNERQDESTQYALVAWQGQRNDVDLQIAPYVRYSTLHYMPDPVGDMIFNGVSSDVTRKDVAIGVQADGSYKINNAHTLRSGLFMQYENAITDNNASVFAADADGNQISDTPVTIADDNQKAGQLYGIYLQDEWKLSQELTLNYGARFDQLNAYVSENQLSPRIGLVYKPLDGTTLHAGYARYFTPPPLELVSASSVTKFTGTTNASTVTQDDAVKAERSHSFDAGVTQKLTDEIQVGADAYYKLVHDMLDEGQFGQALVYTPFNYEHGRIYGLELTASYTGEKLKAYGNFAVSRAMGENIVSAQFNFSPDELAYIKNNYVHLDHDQTYTASGGVSYRMLENTTVGLDGVVGSGLRDGFANTGHLPAYTSIDSSITQDLHLLPKDKTTLRFTVINLFDSVYQLRDGSGIGVGAPQFGQRRGFYASLGQDF